MTLSISPVPLSPVPVSPLPEDHRPNRPPYQGSALLASCWLRVARTALAVILLWALAGWALQWW